MCLFVCFGALVLVRPCACLFVCLRVPFVCDCVCLCECVVDKLCGSVVA